MGSKNEEASDEGLNNPPTSSSSSSPSSSHDWKTRIVIPTLLAGLSPFLSFIMLLLLFRH